MFLGLTLIKDELKPDKKGTVAKLQTQFNHLAVHLAQHHKGSH